MTATSRPRRCSSPFASALAVTILATALLFGSYPASELHAQAAAGPRIEFSIPAGPLSRALDAFARQADVTVEVDRALLDEWRVAAVRGSLGVEQALQRILARTDLEYRFSGPDEITLGRRIYEVSPLRVLVGTRVGET
ncbi:MAG: STN domain-containing protein, partial [Gemmatimonadota bacterium]|nr:STN domain-containing protein [Gemmatimonadota bacterium]